MALTPEQMVAMAIEADCMRVNMYGDVAMAVERLSRFAALVAAREREACAQVCESEWSNVAERMYGRECAAALRARKE